MKLPILTLAVLVASLGGAMNTKATLYDLSYSGSGVAATALINVNASDYAISGSLDVTAGPNQGIYNLYVLPGTPTAGNPDLSPAGAFYVDNLVYPKGSQFLDVEGLLFANNNDTVEFNLWGNGAGSGYSLYGWTGGSYNPSAVVPDTGAKFTAVPEAPTVIAGALLMLPFGASLLRILRKHQVVAD